ncbi:Fanconi anemia core complex-associated protein 20 isoform X2 [Mixophyes fleayi]
MSEEKAAKLKLKRKKCVTKAQGVQDAEVRLQPPPAWDLRQGSTGSWFDEIDLTAAELMWKGVLSAVYPDLRSMGWGSVPALPDFNTKITGKEREKTVSTEVFKVGEQSFEWVPLPTVLPGDTAELPRVIDLEVGIHQQNSRNLAEPITSPTKGLHSLNNAGQSESRPVVLLSNQKEKQVCSKSSTKNVKEPEPSQRVSMKNVKEPEPSQRGSMKNIKDPRPSQKIVTNNKKELQTSQKTFFNVRPSVTSVKNNIEVQKIQQEPKVTEDLCREEPVSNDVVMEDAAASGGRLEDRRESTDQSADVTGSLENCPICLTQFPKRFSQLDMDSHLAQCLSETTVDVVW